MAFDKPYEEKPDSGALHATASKQKETSPDYFGSLTINLKDKTAITANPDGSISLKLSGWKKKNKAGKVYLSLSVSRFVPKEQGSRPAPAPDFGDDSSDIPF
jgi:hypothetical protein